jgi:ribonucrease Y
LLNPVERDILLYLNGLIAAVAGYIIFHLVVFIILAMEKKETLGHYNTLIKEAHRQKEYILSGQKTRTEQSIEILKEEAEEHIVNSKSELNIEIQELEAKLAQLREGEKYIIQKEDILKEKISEHMNNSKDLKTIKDEHKDLKNQFVLNLEQHLEYLPGSQLQEMVTNITDKEQLKAQKRIKLINEELELSSSREAKKTLLRTLHRYEPKFVWPKPPNIAEISNSQLFDYLNSSESQTISQLKDISQVEIEWTNNENNKSIRVAGGYGISKEAAKITLMKLNDLGKNFWQNPSQIYKETFCALEREAIVLGKKAIEQLKIRDLHPELQKLVGALNWRTSYRQNQWLHTIEVATLGGVLAQELGMDEQDAKRVGLLHDIGKVLDYKIEGSHAIISADYADRYGESKYICDTVLSHHSDLVLETPLSYVLRTADALSGARPGARVHIEEGYQIRLSSIQDAINSFPGIYDLSIMNGGREVHIQVDFKEISSHKVPSLAKAIAEKIQEQVAFPGQIKIIVSRTFEATAVA